MNPNLARVIASSNKIDDPIKAEGGDIVISQGYVYHIYSTVGAETFTPLVSISNAEVLAVAGAGAGGMVDSTAGRAGGGGAGGLIPFGSSITFNALTGYNVVVGAGAVYNTSSYDAAGDDTTVQHAGGTLTAKGGGSGGRNYFGSGNVKGTNGGSGGGGCNALSASSIPTGAGLESETPDQGKNGGAGGQAASNQQTVSGGGGGGYSEAGHNYNGTVPGKGGEGYSLPSYLKALEVFEGMDTICSGGGAGGATVSALYPGEVGGDGAGGGRHFSTTDLDATATTYGSGGGGGARNVAGGDGYQGIVLIRYPV